MTATAQPQLNAALSGRYTIERELGAGGMATVYLAHDVKHDRKVALKVLKPELAAVLGAERFVVEIKTTAALQHPHILPLFDSGTADGFLFYVMPFIDGETLRTKLNRDTQLDVDEAVGIAADVGGALDYAHRHGVIHRDIKPENILLHDGRPMVADFGIALAVSAAAGGRMTETGLSLGTPHYMSPEQATAEKDITARSDVYSLASVLYEMLAGTPPHTGASAQQIIMKIITETPAPVTKLRKSVPPNVAAALARALEKLPADRFPSARAFLDALASPSYAGTAATSAAGMPTFGTRSSRRAVAALGAVALLALAAAAWGWLRPQPVAPVRRLDLTLGPAPLLPNTDVAISPDGSMIAYAGAASGSTTPSIWLRRLDGDQEFRMLAGTESGLYPDFSPDNQWIVFRRGTTGLAKVSVSGGGVATILASNTAYFPHWGTPDRILFNGPPGAFIVPAEGGTPVAVPGVIGRRIFLLPDGSGVLGQQGSDVVVYDLASGKLTVLVRNARHPVYASSGHLLYITEENALFAVPFALRGHRVTGPARRVVDRVANSLGSRGYSVSNTGTLLHHEGPGSGQATAANRLVVARFGGGSDTLPLPKGRQLSPRFSPNGRYVAYLLSTTRGNGDEDIYTYDLVTGTNTQLTFEGNQYSPIWSPDGTRILYATDSTNGARRLRIKPADNSGADQPLAAGSGSHTPSDWPREDLIAFTGQLMGGTADLFTMSPKPGQTPQSYLKAPWDELEMVLSPDGRLAAFTARETGNNDIWLRDFPTPTGKWRVSPTGGQHPRWSRDGRYIYFWRTGPLLDTLVRTRVDRAPQVIVRAPEVVGAYDAAGIVNWDLHPDGKRFIFTMPDNPVAGASGAPGTQSASRHLVVLNWFTELNAAFGTRK